MRKTYHILNGDALNERFPASIAGERIVLRECLVDGPVVANSLQEFYQKRSEFISVAYGLNDDYFKMTVPELEKLDKIEEGASVNYWFEDDLFCQANLWYALHRTGSTENHKSLVRPDVHSRYGFARFDEHGLTALYAKKIDLVASDRLYDLWKYYAREDHDGLLHTATQLKELYPFIAEAVNAHLARQPNGTFPGRPIASLLAIQQELKTQEFAPVFQEFCVRESIYGFGDLQVKYLMDQIAEP